MRSQPALVLAVVLALSGQAFAASPPTITKATDGIFDAFRTHSLVGLGDSHGLAQELDFYSALIRDPRFAGEVGNVVLEVGDARYQATADSYVNGEKVPYPELRKVWADTVGFTPTVLWTGYVNLYDTIRLVNMTLPPEGRIKVWLGDPPVDWSQITTSADLSPLRAQRDTYPAGLIEREILAKGKKALVIYGQAHLFPTKDNLRALVESAHPGALFVVQPYLGYVTADCAAPFEKHIQNWPTPAMLSPIRGSSWENEVFRPGCGDFPRSPGMTETEYDANNRDNMGLTSDALLYLGPRNKMVWSQWNPDIYMDSDFRSEIDRRQQIRTGKPLKGFTADQNPSVLEPYFPN